MKITRLSAKDGLSLQLLNYGATIQQLNVPSSNGPINVVLGYQDPEDYLDDPCYHGCTLGRYAGRIEGGRFDLDGVSHQLDCNDETFGHCLHGGAQSLSKREWDVVDSNEVSVCFATHSKAGDQGFPGALDVQARYSLAGPMTLQIDLVAESDADTILNLSNHSYFNLSGQATSIERHEVWLNSDLYLPMTERMLPSGDVRSVSDSPFDFRHAKAVGEGIAAGGPQIERAGGIDHFFLLNRSNHFPPLAAAVYAPESGVRMKVYTSQPGVQFYTGNFLDEPFMKRQGLCLECQTTPNAPNLQGLPDAYLKAGERYHHTIIWTFDR